MNVLITGGAGFIGSHLSKLHLDKNDSVTVIDNLITGSKKNIEALMPNPSFVFLQEDICTFNFSTNQKFDLIYHLASPASPKQYAHYPLETLLASSRGLQNILEFVRTTHTGIKIVYASTSEVYGDPLEHPQQETYWGNVNSFGPRSCYDEAKRFGEALCYTYLHKYHLDIRIGRIFNTYGPHMERKDGRAVSNFIVQALSNKDITLYGDGIQTRSFCFVSDLVEGLYKMTTADVRGEVINLGNPDEKNIKELSLIIKRLTSSTSSIVFQPLPGDDPQKRQPDITKARTLLGWQPVVPLEAGLTKTINYFKERFNL